MNRYLRYASLICNGLTTLGGLLIWANFWPYVFELEVLRGGLDVLYGLVLGIGLLMISVGVENIRRTTVRQ